MPMLMRMSFSGHSFFFESTRFGISNFGHSALLGIWDLSFGIFILSCNTSLRRFNKTNKINYFRNLIDLRLDSFYGLIQCQTESEDDPV